MADSEDEARRLHFEAAASKSTVLADTLLQFIKTKAPEATKEQLEAFAVLANGLQPLVAEPPEAMDAEHFPQHAPEAEDDAMLEAAEAKFRERAQLAEGDEKRKFAEKAEEIADKRTRL